MQKCPGDHHWGEKKEDEPSFKCASKEFITFFKKKCMQTNNIFHIPESFHASFLTTK